MKVVVKIKSLSLLLCLLVNLLSTASEDSNTFHGIHLTLYYIRFAGNTGVKLNGRVETSSVSPSLSLSVLNHFYTFNTTVSVTAPYLSLHEH